MPYASAMKRWLRFLLWLAGTAVFLLLTAHFTLRHLLNAPTFKAAATGFIERATGRSADYGRIDYELFPFSLVVRDAALKEKDKAAAALKPMMEAFDRRRRFLHAELNKIPGIVFECPKGAFYLMAALPVDDAEKFQQWLLEEFDADGDTVMITPGEGFYATPGKGRNEARMAYVLKQADLERAMDVLAIAIEKYNSR